MKAAVADFRLARLVLAAFLVLKASASHVAVETFERSHSAPSFPASLSAFALSAYGRT